MKEIKSDKKSISNIFKSALLSYFKDDKITINNNESLIEILLKYNIIKFNVNDFKYWILTAAQCGNIDFLDIMIKKSKEIEIYNIEDFDGINIDVMNLRNNLIDNIKNTLLIISIYQKNLNMIYYILSLGISNYNEAYIAIENLDNLEIKEKIYNLIDGVAPITIET